MKSVNAVALLFTLIAAILFFACNNTQQPKPATKADTIKPLGTTPDSTTPAIQPNAGDSILLEHVFDSLAKLPKVKILTDAMQKHPKLNHKLGMLTISTPANGQPYYWIKVGEDTPDNFVTIYHFHVYLHPLRIMNLDVEDEKELSLDEWEKKKD